jgi:hypothetical protein
MDSELLVGERLTSVEFFTDQVCFRFEENALTLFNWPLVADAEGVSIGFGEPGYRDALCMPIGLCVESATYTEGIELTLTFPNEVVFALSCREEDLNSSSVGIFTLNGESQEF